MEALEAVGLGYKKTLMRYVYSNKEVYMGLGIFLLTFVIRLAYFTILGIQSAGDTGFYLRHSNIIIEAGGNFFALADSGLPFYYWVYPMFLALFNNNLSLVVLAHIFLHGITAFLVYKIGERVFNQATGIVAGIGFAFFWEIMHWNLYILTDSLFLFALVAAVFAYLQAIDKNTYLRWIFFGASLLFILFLRPTALPFFTAVFFLLTYNWRRFYKYTIVALIVFLCAWFLREIILTAPEARLGIGGYVHYFISLYEDGVVIRDRPGFMLPIVWDTGFSLVNFYNFLYIFAYRLIAFWLLFVSSFSFSHILINIVTLVPLYIFGVIGAYKGIVKKENNQLVMFLVLIIIFFWFFQALTEIDYDLRYRLPALPFLLLLAAFGFTSTILKVAEKLINYQIVRYGIVGVGNLTADFVVLNISLLVLGLNLFWATFLGFLTGGVLGYFLHSRWTFKYDTSGQNMLKFSHFIFIAIIGLTITEITMHYATYLGLHYNYAKIIAIIISVSWAYSATKWWVFRETAEIKKY